MAFKKEYANKIVAVKGTALNVRELPGTASKALLTLKAGQTAGRSSGQTSAMSDGEWLQVNLYTPVDGVKYGYVRRDVVNLVEPKKEESNVAKDNAESLVNSLLKQDQQILRNLTKAAKTIALIKSKGIDTSAIEREVTKYINRLGNRQSKIIAAQKTGMVTIEKGYTTGLTVTKDFVNKYNINMLIGVPKIGNPAALIIVGAVVIGGLTAAALYYFLKPDYEDSKLDFVITDNLQKEIDKYIPKEKQAAFNQVLQQEAQPQLNDAYNAGKNDQKFGDILSVGKYILIFGAGFFLVDKLITTQSNKRKLAA